MLYEPNTLLIDKKNEVYMSVQTEPGLAQELCDYFTFYVPGYRFMPAYRNKIWDGKIRLFNLRNKLFNCLRVYWSFSGSNSY